MKNILIKRPLDGFEIATSDPITLESLQAFLNLGHLNLVMSGIL
jgi:hypothetical protein